MALTFPYGESDARAIACPLCSQTVKVERHGTRLWVRCDARCNERNVLEALGDARVEGILAELTAESPRGDSASDTSPATLRRLDVAQMVREEPPAVPWVVDGLVVRGMLSVLNGREGEGKSLLTMALAAGVATGQDEAGMVCHEGGVVIVDAENGAYEIHRRVRTLELPPAVEVFEADGFDIRHDLAELEAVLDEHRPALLVLDSFRSLWRGDENDSGDVAAALDPLRNLVRRYEVGTILLHHSGKGQGAAYRGSSAIGASCELGFKLAREEGDEERERRYLECWKCRPAPEPERRWLRLSAEGGRVYVDAAEPLGGDEREEPTTVRPVREELRPRVLAALTSEPQSRADIARATGREPKDRSVGRVLEALHAEGIAYKDGPDGRPKWSLTGGGIAADPPIGVRHPATFDSNPLSERDSGGGNPDATLPPDATSVDPLKGLS